MGEDEIVGTRAAAFFDVDGTIQETTIVDYYMYFRARRMSPRWRPIWRALYLLRCIPYLVLDKIDRSRLNVVFYRSYARLSVADVTSLVSDCFQDVMLPRQFPAAFRCVKEHRAVDRSVVLVTGSIGFIIEPLAEHLGGVDVLAPTLLESDGRFTGELSGPPVGDEEKARRVRHYAERNGIDLASSFAYGDSIADLPMLECVGHPQAVNPDRALARKAREKDWPIHRWSLDDTRRESIR